MISNALFRLALFILTGQLLISPALAQIKSQTSTGEDIAIAFFKTAGTNPDFDLWAAGGAKYKNAPPASGGKTLGEEKQRLMRLWQDYDTDHDTLDVKSPVLVELKKTMDSKGDEQYWMYMEFAQGKATYFPYVYQEYKFAVIPQMIEKMSIQQLTRQQYELVQKSLGNKGGTGDLFLQLKPVKAYIQQPYNIDNVEQWMFLCDIASLTLRTPKEGTLLWNYGADWYVAPETEELMDLYKKPMESILPQ